jgi:hypothetical protein
MLSYLKRKVLWSRKLRLTTVRDRPRSQRDTPLSAKVGTKFRRQLAVAQSVYFTWEVKATESVFFIILGLQMGCQLGGSGNTIRHSK